MNYFDAYISLIFFTKIVFVILAFTRIYMKMTGKEKSELYKKIVYLKQKLELIFIVLMALLLIYLFNPIKNNISMIDRETKLLLYLFGFVLIITAKW